MTEKEVVDRKKLLAVIALLTLCALTLIDAHEATKSAMLGTTAISRRLDIVEENWRVMCEVDRLLVETDEQLKAELREERGRRLALRVEIYKVAEEYYLRGRK